MMKRFFFPLNTFVSITVAMVCSCFVCTAQEAASTSKNLQSLKLEKISAQGIELKKGWKFRSGDSLSWASPAFDDAGWSMLNPAMQAAQFRQFINGSIGWLRLNFSVDSSDGEAPLILRLQQNAASEIYLDGVLLKRYGTLSTNTAEVKAYNPLNQPLALPLKSSSPHVLAVRICLPQYTPGFKYPQLSNGLFHATLYDWSQNQPNSTSSFNNTYGITLVKAGLFAFLLLLHFSFYFLFKKQKTTLYFACFDLCSVMAYIFYALLCFKVHDVQTSNLLRIPAVLFYIGAFWFNYLANVNLYAYKSNKMYYTILLLMVVTVIIYFTPLNREIEKVASLQLFIFPMLTIAECLRMTIGLIRKIKSGVHRFIAPVGIVCLLSIASSIVTLNLKSAAWAGMSDFSVLLLNSLILALPVSAMLFVAGEFNFYYRKLLKAQALKDRIALDLHDDLGTKLSTAKIFLGTIKMRPQTEDTDKALLKDAVHLIDTSVSDLRQIMNELQTSNLMEKGYITAAEELINKISNLREISFTLSHTGINQRLEQKTEYNLYRITQELINNTLKYAKAANVTIDLVTRGGKIIFVYEDDGIGFDTSVEKNGYGLANILSRAESLGGTVDFDSSPGTGFRSIIEIPLAYA